MTRKKKTEAPICPRSEICPTDKEGPQCPRGKYICPYGPTPPTAQKEERIAVADPTQNRGTQAMPAPTKNGAGGVASGGPEPSPGISPPGQAPTLELTPQNLADVINTLAKNDQVFLDEIKRLRDEVSSMRGGYSQRQIPATAPGAPAQETPEIFKQIAPLAMAAVAKFLGPAEEAKPKSRIAELVEAKLAARLDSMIEKSLQNISDLMDAEVEGRVMITEKKEMPKTG